MDGAETTRLQESSDAEAGWPPVPLRRVRPRGVTRDAGSQRNRRASRAEARQRGRERQLPPRRSEPCLRRGPGPVQGAPHRSHCLLINARGPIRLAGDDGVAKCGAGTRRARAPAPQPNALRDRDSWHEGTNLGPGPGHEEDATPPPTSARPSAWCGSRQGLAPNRRRRVGFLAPNSAWQPEHPARFRPVVGVPPAPTRGGGRVTELVSHGPTGWTSRKSGRPR